ncbi:cupin [Rhodococcoides trifolii]|uniref:Cupin n=1 Tax=Rhodococcoides trifolii TaxID=908250 RepID=A0A917FSX0_9NOCA|nr:AraC family transcriptional regulator [Rhodococcus trifolii]GGG02362.1 cupin [Rhodococcus trifolii]
MTISDPSMWRGTDALGDALHALRMQGAFYIRSELTDPWGLDIPAMSDCIWFHMPVAGDCWLELDGHDPTLLRTGDCVLVPHGRGHSLVGAPGQPSVSMYEPEAEWVSDRYIVIEHGGGGPATTLVCGAVKFEHPSARGLLDVLPEVMQVQSSAGRSRLGATLDLLTMEAADRRPGGEAVITRLADILVIQMIRAWMEDDPAAQTGWLGALRDKQIGRAILAIHREPERDWTVESLARHVAMSRSAFAARFTEMVGEPAVSYLTRYRMQVATTELAETGVVVSELAGRLGYRSEAAFSRAYKRTTGVSPGSMRKR